MSLGLEDLPVELLYAVQLCALSDTLPHVSRHLYRVFKSAPPSFHAEYILGRLLPVNSTQIITSALRYPLCTMETFDAPCRHANIAFSPDLFPQLPRRFFYDLPCRGLEWTEDDHPLPFLKHLYDRFPMFVDNESYVTKAAQACFLPLISFLLDQYSLFDGQSSLTWAARYGHGAVVEMLLAQVDIDVNSKDARGNTALSSAAWRGDNTMVKLLLAQDGIDVNSRDKDGSTPLSLAAKRGYNTVVEMLLAQDDIDVNSKDVDGNTPLYFAVGYEHAVKMLLARDDIDVNNTSGSELGRGKAVAGAQRSSN